MNNLRRAALLLAIPLALAACGERQAASSSPSASASAPGQELEFGIPASMPATVGAASQLARGFETGNMMSARKVFVFFDPQCPHCAAFWEEAKKLEREARFVWVPVGILNKKSALQAATILSAQDPVRMMQDNELSIQAKQGGIVPSETLDPAVRASVAKNTRLLASFGAEGVPFLVATGADGKPFSGNGRSADSLASVLGWRSAAAAQPAGAPKAPN